MTKGRDFGPALVSLGLGAWGSRDLGESEGTPLPQGSAGASDSLLNPKPSKIGRKVRPDDSTSWAGGGRVR